MTNQELNKLRVKLFLSILEGMTKSEWDNFSEKINLAYQQQTTRMQFDEESCKRVLDPYSLNEK